MSWLSNFVDQVLPGAPMQNITENTFDKWIAPEDKDTVEMIASAVAMPAVVGALAPGLAAGLGISETAATQMLNVLGNAAQNGWKFDPVALAAAGLDVAGLEKASNWISDNSKWLGVVTQYVQTGEMTPQMVMTLIKNAPVDEIPGLENVSSFLDKTQDQLKSMLPADVTKLWESSKNIPGLSEIIGGVFKGAGINIPGVDMSQLTNIVASAGSKIGDIWNTIDTGKLGNIDWSKISSTISSILPDMDFNDILASIKNGTIGSLLQGGSGDSTLLNTIIPLALTYLAKNEAKDYTNIVKDSIQNMATQANNLNVQYANIIQNTNADGTQRWDYSNPYKMEVVNGQTVISPTDTSIGAYEQAIRKLSYEMINPMSSAEERALAGQRYDQLTTQYNNQREQLQQLAAARGQSASVAENPALAAEMQKVGQSEATARQGVARDIYATSLDRSRQATTDLLSALSTVQNNPTQSAAISSQASSAANEQIKNIYANYAAIAQALTQKTGSTSTTDQLLQQYIKQLGETAATGTTSTTLTPAQAIAQGEIGQIILAIIKNTSTSGDYNPNAATTIDTGYNPYSTDTSTTDVIPSTGGTLSTSQQEAQNQIMDIWNAIQSSNSTSAAKTSAARVIPTAQITTDFSSVLPTTTTDQSVKSSGLWSQLKDAATAASQQQEQTSLNSAVKNAVTQNAVDQVASTSNGSGFGNWLKQLTSATNEQKQNSSAQTGSQNTSSGNPYASKKRITGSLATNMAKVGY